MFIAEYMLNYRDDEASPPTPEAIRKAVQKQEAIKKTHVAERDTQNGRCLVCRLEHNIIPAGLKAHGLRTDVVRWMCACCNVTAHNYVVRDDLRHIHSIRPKFKGKTCFDIIIHKETGFNLWSRATGKVRPSHPLYKDIRQSHVLADTE
jgi:hypothetical protein